VCCVSLFKARFLHYYFVFIFILIIWILHLFSFFDSYSFHRFVLTPLMEDHPSRRATTAAAEEKFKRHRRSMSESSSTQAASSRLQTPTTQQPPTVYLVSTQPLLPVDTPLGQPHLYQIHPHFLSTSLSLSENINNPSSIEQSNKPIHVISARDLDGMSLSETYSFLSSHSAKQEFQVCN